MKQIRANISEGSILLSSREIQDIIEDNPYFEEVTDISHTVHDENVLAYDVKLDSSILEREVEKDLKEEGYVLEDEEMYTSVMYEQAEYFIDAAMDEIKDRIETRYHLTNVGGAYKIYENGNYSENLEFILTLSFGRTSHGQLYQITNAILDKGDTKKSQRLL